ncbi:MAG: NAD-dependent epimerase/dehydratase family protein [Vicinamibacteria bacterium]
MSQETSTSTPVTPAVEGRSIAVTGSSGFLGGELIRRLNRLKGVNRLVSIDVRKPSVNFKKLRTHRVDLTEPAADAKLAKVLAKEKCDTLIHTAFLSGPTTSATFAHELESIGTMQVLHACAEQQIRKIIFASTTMVYGAQATNPNYLTEEHTLRGDRSDRFIRDRIEVEEMVKSFRSKQKETVVTVLRPCWVMGPTVDNFVTRFFGRPVVATLLGYDHLLQFVHEDDLFDALEIVIEKDRPGVYNIVGTGVLPLSTLLRLAGKISLPILHVAAYPLANLLWASRLGDAPATLLDYIRYIWVADGTKAKLELGFEAKYSTKEAWMAFIGSRRLRRYV